MSKCKNQNGTYVCYLPKGHSGSHMGKTPNITGRAALGNKAKKWPNKSMPWHKR